MDNQKGITMLEVLMSIVILVILVSISFTGYRSWQRKVQVINNKDELSSALYRAQQLATAAADNTSWGIHLEDTYYVMFPGDFYNTEHPDNRTWFLNGSEILNTSTTFSNGAGGYGADVVFNKFTGQTANTGTVTIISSSDSTLIKTVTVQSSGQIY